MLKYIQRHIYNYFNTESKDANGVVKYPKTFIEEDYENDRVNLNPNIDEKQLRIDILLYIKQVKNTYYKYTNNPKFNQELYNSFGNDENFDGGDTAFDDDDNMRIFDKYVIDYIKHRNEIITYLQCKNKHVISNKKLTDLEDIRTLENTIDILFVIDMSDKDIFDYCYSLVKNRQNCATTKSILFSMVFKMNNEFVRIKLNSYKNTTKAHPYLIIENALI